MIRTISAKDLRAKFPWVQDELSNGTTFIVICRSKPIAELKPLENREHHQWLALTEKSLDFWNHPSNDAYAKLLS